MPIFFVTVVWPTTAELGAKTVLKQKKMFLETETSFPYCNWSTKMAGIILDVFRKSVSSLQGRGDLQGTPLQTISATDGLPWYPWAPNEGLACLQIWFHPSAQTEIFDGNLDCHTVEDCKTTQNCPSNFYHPFLCQFCHAHSETVFFFF